MRAWCPGWLYHIFANYEGDEHFVLGTAPVYNMETISEDESARLAFVAPIVNVPIAIPINVRSESDYGLRISINAISQTSPSHRPTSDLGAARQTGTTTHSASIRPGRESPPGCPGSLSIDCLTAPYPGAGIGVRAFTRQPERLHGETASGHGRGRRPTRTPNPSRSDVDLSADHQLRKPEIRPGLPARPDDRRSRRPVRARHPAESGAVRQGVAPSQSNLRSGVLTLPPGLTINPDAADGQTSCTDAQAGFGSIEGPGECPDNVEDRHRRRRHAGAGRAPRSARSTSANRCPATSTGLFMLFDGFGMHAKLVGLVHSRIRSRARSR